MAGSQHQRRGEKRLSLHGSRTSDRQAPVKAVGEVDSRLETVADWKEPYRKGVVYYLRDGRVRGVLLWNVWEQVDAARKLIAEPGPFRPEGLKGRLPA